MNISIPAVFILVFLLIVNYSEPGEFKSSGLSEIDEARLEVPVKPTTTANAIQRRATLYRWWRLLWHQGYDMESFDGIAERLLRFPDSTVVGRQAITEGFRDLEEIFYSGKKIPEIRGKISNAATSQTNWPLYHGINSTQQGYSPDEGPSAGNIVWKFPKSYGCNITPFIDSGKVYVAGLGDDVIAYCLDESNGKVLWKGRRYGTSYYHNTGKHRSAFLAGNKMLIAEGSRIKYFDKRNGNEIFPNKSNSLDNTVDSKNIRILKRGLNQLYCIDTETGDVIKKIVSPDKISGKAKIFSNTIYFVTYDGTLHARSIDKKDKSWERSYGIALDGSITTDKNGTLYLGATDGNLVAISAGNGEVVWKFKTSEIESRARQLFSEVFVHNNKLYLGAANKKVYCLSAEDGKLLWEFEADDWIRSKPVIIDENLYVADLSGVIYAIKENSSTANLIWKNKIEEHGFTANLDGSENGILAVSQNQMLYSVSPRTGETQWRHGLLDGIFIDDVFQSSEELGGQQSSPVVADGVLYIGGVDGFVNAVDTESGEELWRFETDGSVSSSPTLAFGKVFFGEAYDAKGTYYALDQKTGIPEWQSDAYGNVWVNATFDEQHIYFGNMDGYFFAVDPSTGKKIWQYNTAKDSHVAEIPPEQRTGHGFPPGVYCNPVYDRGVVYTGSWAGYYFAFDAKTGALKWRTKTKPEGIIGGLPDSSAPVLSGSHLYVQKAGWQLAAININTGKIDWEWNAPTGYLQNGTITALGNQIFGSVIRQVTNIPYDASIIAFSDVKNGGNELWRYEGGGGLTAAVATKDKLIFGSSGDVFITCLNPENGNVKWRTYTGGMMLESVPAIYGKRAFFQCKNGYIFAFE